MTQEANPGVYVYQPLGPTKTNPDRIFGIGGLPLHFTREEAGSPRCTRSGDSDTGAA